MTPARAPIPYDPAAGDRAVTACAPPPDWAEVVRGAAGCAPFLAGLFARERDWLGGVWGADPAAALDGVLAEVARVEGDPSTPLRVAKRRVAALVALADLGGVWTTMEATAALTRFADAALGAALDWGLARRGLADAGLAAFAMGKMGAGELNYSSDVDLILLMDAARHGDGFGAARAEAIRAARLAVAAMQDVTPEGYVFRVDLRLRPDPSSTPIVIATEAAERYYEGLGRAWERAAWIKARPCAGDPVVGAAVLSAMRPFVWRRHLDFAAVEDAHAMRLGIRAHREMRADWDVPGHDLKLGQGGIREIEFFAQTRQLIAGGRDPSLRARGTLAALDALAAAGWVPEADRAVLSGAYGHLRDAEHRLQMVGDARTHRVPRDAEGIARAAGLAGQAPDAFVAGLRETLGAVERIVDPFFAPAPARAAPAEPPGAEAAAARWRAAPALRSERARNLFDRVRPALMAGLAGAARPDEALLAFEGFLTGLPAGVQLFALFEANPALIELIVDVCATSPDLGRALAGRSDVLDAVLDGSFLAPLDGFAPPPPGDGFEATLDGLRRWNGEARFRIDVHLLRGLAAPEEAGAAYARLAEATLGAAWAAAETETARRYGRVTGLRLAGLAMGSLGAGRMTTRSDLDLVVIHDGGAGVSDGRRALGPGQWAARFAQVLITALTAPTAAGRLYEVDMRLRPSGRQGPVAVPLSGWQAYQAERAWAWEHLALTRARAVAGDGGLRDAAEAARHTVLASGRFAPAEVVGETAAMLARLPRGAGLAVTPARRRIALAAQAHALMAGAAARDVPGQLAVPGWLSEAEREALAGADARLADVETAMRLLGPEGTAAPDGAGGAALLARVAGADDPVAACDVAIGRAEDAIGVALMRGAA